MTLNYDQTKAANLIATDLEGLSGLSPDQQAIVNNAVAACPQYGENVMHGVVTDLGWSITTPSA